MSPVNQVNLELPRLKEEYLDLSLLRRFSVFIVAGAARVTLNATRITYKREIKQCKHREECS